MWRWPLYLCNSTHSIIPPLPPPESRPTLLHDHHRFVIRQTNHMNIILNIWAQFIIINIPTLITPHPILHHTVTPTACFRSSHRQPPPPYHVVRPCTINVHYFFQLAHTLSFSGALTIMHAYMHNILPPCARWYTGRAHYSSLHYTILIHINSIII